MLIKVNSFPDFKTRLIQLQNTKGNNIVGFSKPRESLPEKEQDQSREQQRDWISAYAPDEIEIPEPTIEEVKNYDSKRPKRENKVSLKFDEESISKSVREVSQKLKDETEANKTLKKSIKLS